MRAQSIFGKLVVLVIAVVIISILSTTFISLIPSSLSETKEIASYNMNLDKSEIPCLLSCYSPITGDIDRLLREGNYLFEGKATNLIDYFHCNTEILKVSTMIFELAKWKDVRSKEVYSEGTRYERGTNILYDCLTKAECDNSLYNTMKQFCELDDYLFSFGFINCNEQMNFNDYLNPRRFKYKIRIGSDIDNDFVCDPKIKDYKGPYDLCFYEAEAKYSSACQPAWKTLRDQQLYLGEKGVAEGRCEDFALLYKTLFKSIGMSEEELTLTMGYCKLNPKCFLLFNQLNTDSFKKMYGFENATYELINCVPPANLTVKGLGVIEGCDKRFTQNYPDEYYSEFRLTVKKGDDYYNFIINQPFNEEGYYRNLSFNGVISDDPRWYSFINDNGVNKLILEDNQLWTTSGDFLANGLVINKGVITDLGSDKFYFGDTLAKTGSDPKTSGVHFFSNVRSTNFGLNFNLKSITGCEATNITIRLGIEGGCGSNSFSDFIVREGEFVSLLKELNEGSICLLNNDLGNELIPSIELIYPSDCTIDYEISNWALMNNYPKFFGLYSYTKTCQDFVTSGVKIDPNGIETEAVIDDLFS